MRYSLRNKQKCIKKYITLRLIWTTFNLSPLQGCRCGKRNVSCIATTSSTATVCPSLALSSFVASFFHIAVWSYCSCSSCSTITWGDHLGEKMPLPVLVAQWQTHFLCAVMPPSFLRETSFLVGRPNSIVKERFHELKCFKPLSSQTFSQISCSKRSAFSQVADL